MIYNLNSTQQFDKLKEYYIPAIFHHVLKGRKKVYQLSISMDGKEKVIKKSPKKFKHTSFSNVILGSVMRMKKLFAPEALNLGVILINVPDSKNLRISFELVNKNRFIIAGEEYILSIIAEYSYKKMETVTYYPVLYRQTCSNGAVMILNDQFKEVISVDKIMDIGCEWTKCNFETYINQVQSFFEELKSTQLTMSQSEMINFIEKILKINLKESRRKKNVKADLFEMDRPERNIENVIDVNLERLGNNNFALWNSLTEFASRQENWEIRNEYFMKIGKYLFNETKKATRDERKKWSENLSWGEVVAIVNSKAR